MSRIPCCPAAASTAARPRPSDFVHFLAVMRQRSLKGWTWMDLDLGLSARKAGFDWSRCCD